MKKLFGKCMSRRTEIIDEELIEDITFEEKFNEEVFLELSETFKEEQRLLKRFYNFCEEYENFEYDESGINMDEADDILRKCNKIRDLILSNVEAKLLYRFDNIGTNTHKKMITANLSCKNNSFRIVTEVMNDSFNLELL